MVHSRIIIGNAQLLIIVLLESASYKTEGSTSNHPEFETVIKYLRDVIKPYVESRKSPDLIQSESKLEDIIKIKIDELKPLLQDSDNFKHDEHSKELALEGEEETTIIEFRPKKKSIFRHDSFKNNKLLSNIEEYKKIRDKIKIALEHEMVTKATQRLVIQTLDEMINRLISKQCTWKSGRSRFDRASSIASRWNEEWRMLKEKYKEYNLHNDGTFPGIKLFKFFEQFHDFLTHIGQDAATFSKRFGFVCQIVDRQKNGNSNNALRKGNRAKKYPCESFKVCSYELQKFMIDFYNSLNDTAVGTLKNYAAMYVRDVDGDGTAEKENVVYLVGQIGDLSEYKTSKIYKKLVMNFQLDKGKNKQENIKVLRNFIKDAIVITKGRINEKIDGGLQSLRADLQNNIKQDLKVNLEVDLGNLEQDYKDQVCSAFAVCNGRYSSRRGDNNSQFSDENRVYVNVELTIDDELVDGETQTRHSAVKESTGINGKGPNQLQVGSDKRAMTEGAVKNNVAINKYEGNVTRTTLASFKITNIMKIEPVMIKTTLKSNRADFPTRNSRNWKDIKRNMI